MKLTKFIKEKFAFPLTFGVTEQAEKFRNKLVLTSRKVASVTDAKSQNLAVDIARDIRSWVADVEKKRVELTKPLLAAQRKIKALADDHCEPLNQEQGRLERLVSDFQAQERKRVEEEERKQQEELKVALKAQNEAEQNGQDVSELKQIVQAALAVPLPAPAKASGVATREVVKWIVTDKAALFKARPELFSVEIRPSAVNAVCFPNDLKASFYSPDTTSIPGLAMWFATESVVRKW